ncbi:MAG: efflux RND transporter periplasmic adaptor subunit, partial [Kordiimonadaceae bacterium]|nr:efflux RND transporter periplasmic adaptor subunit [Kordiimonadaceae bacterium]
MNKSYKTAALIVVGIVLVLLSGVFFPYDDNEAATNPTQTVAAAMSVTVINSSAEPYVKDIVLRGYTESLRSVSLKSQLKGRISALPVEKGMRVSKGDIICSIDVEDREANYAESIAIVTQRELEHKASAELFKKGHRSETQHSSAKALLDTAIARASRSKVNLDNTQIRAPFDGIINDRPIEIGDYMKEGEVCALIMEEDPFLIVADISENQISQAKIGQEAHAILQGGRRIEGKIRYVSSIADKSTRTFRVELEIPNPNSDIREGITAELFLRGDEVPAQKISAATLVLEDNGLVGVRVVDQDNQVQFRETEILGNHENGIWVTAIPSE